jgi:hypothetical protein
MAENELQNAIKKQNLPEFLAIVLEKLALEAGGVDRAAACDWISLQTNRVAPDCNEAILDLGLRNLVLEVTNDDRSEVRLVANYQKLEVSEATRQALHLRSQPFQTLDFPHSAKAMATLNALLRDEAQELFIVLAEATNHKFFSELEHRAKQGRKTTFLIPKETAIPSERRSVYQQEIASWVTFLKRDNALLRNVKILVTPKPYKHLYTSTLGPNYVRYDVFELDDKSTKTGEMIQVQRGMSLYELVYREYCEAIYYSSPIFKLWPGEWFKRKIGRYIFASIMIMLFVFLCWLGISTDKKIIELLAVFPAGMAYHALYDELRSKRWKPPELYQR